MLTSIKDVDLLTQTRLTSHPGHPLFEFAKREIDRLEMEIGDKTTINQAFYESMKIDLMCARELENIDQEYCKAVYQMMEDIRPK